MAQTRAEIEKAADELFEEEAYLEAGKLYLKLITDQQRRKDHDLNFRYGTCLLKGEGEKKTEAISFLSYAVKKPSIDDRAYFFLGNAYQYNYQFDLALKQYNKFKKEASSSLQKKYRVDNNIKACNNGKKLLSNVTDMIVLKKTEIKAENFYDLYKTNDIGGTILVYDEFQTKYDKKVGHRPIIHFPKKSPFIYYSSYGEDGSTGLDIYVIKKLPNGKWSKSQKIIGSVNTFQDESYPYMSPSGKYLYFSSKGHNSMGGYDVFRSVYNPGDNSFGKPENMDFAISSPDDDIFYIVDSLDRIAYFASARESEAGKLYVYKVRVEKIPMQMAVIKGTFTNEILASNKKIEIVVTDYSNGNEIGKFNSKSRNGGILMTFPKSGKYNFVMTVDGEDVSHAAVITIPYLREFRPLKMNIKHYNNANNEHSLTVEQLFDEKFDNPTAILAEVYKEMSKLPPNGAQFDLDSLDKLRATDDVFVEAGMDPFVTKSDIEKIIDDRITNIEDMLAESKTNSYKAYHLATEKFEAAEAKNKEAKKLIDKANVETNEVKKRAILQEVYKLSSQAKADKKEAEEFLELGHKIDQDTERLTGQLTEAKSAKLGIKTADENDRVALADAVSKNGSFFNNQIKNPQDDSVIEKIESEGHSGQKASSKLNDELVSLRKQNIALEKSTKQLQKELSTAKKKKEKARLTEKIQSNQSEFAVISEVIKSKEKELNNINASSNEIDLTASAETVTNPKYNTEEYTKAIHPNDIVKLNNRIKGNDFNTAIKQIDKVLSDNGIAGEFVSLTGLDESRTDFSESEWKEAYDSEIQAQKKLLANTQDTEKKKKIEYEIKRLEKAKAEKFEDIDSQGPTVEKENLFDEIIDNHKEKLNDIAQISDDVERKKAENEFNNLIIANSKSEIEKLENELANDPDNEYLKNKLNLFKDIQNEAKTKVKDNENWLNVNSTDEQKGNTTAFSDIKSVVPNYETSLRTIEDSENSEQEKRDKLKILNETTLASVDEKIQENNAVLANNPDNKIAKQNNELLEEIKTKIENNPEEALLSPSTISDISEVSSKVDVNELVPNYENKILNIESSNKIDIDKAKAKLEINSLLEKRIDQQIIELTTAIETNPSNKKVLTKRIKNLKTLKVKTQQKITEDSSFIKNNTHVNISTDEIADINGVNPNYEKEIERINTIDNQTEKDKAKKELLTETLTKIDEKISVVSTELGKNPDNTELIKEKDELNNLKTKLEEDLNNVSGNDLAKVSPVVVAGDLIPGFYDKLDVIDNSNNTETDKAKSKVSLHTSLLSKIDEELTRLDLYLGTVPDNKKDVEKRIKNLEKLRNYTEREISESKDKIKEDSITLDPNAITNVNTINPDYLKLREKAKVLENESEKIEAINSLNKNTIKLVETKIEEVEIGLNDDPNNFSLKQDKIALINLKNQLKSEITDQNLSVNSVDYSNVSASVDVNNLLAGYDKTKQDITNSNETESNQSVQKIELENKLISKIDTEVNGLETYLLTDPDNKKDVEKRLKNLIKLKENVLNNIELEKAKINSDSQINENAIANVNTIDVEYQNKLADAQNIENVEERNKIIKSLNDNVIVKIDIRLANIEAGLATNPNDEKLKQEKIELINLKTQLLKANNELSNKKDYSTASTSIEAGDLIKDYTNQINSIDNNGTSDSDKAKFKIELNTKLLSKIDLELAELEAYLKTDPDNKKDIEKRIKSANKLKTAIVKENESLTKDVKDETTIGSISIGDLIPDFEKQSNQIDNNDNLTNTEKLNAKNNLNTDLITKINLKITELNALKDKEPKQADVINEQIDKLNELKTVKGNEIEENNKILNAEIANSNTVIKTAKVTEVSELTTDNFTTENGKEAFNKLKEDFTELDKTEKELEELELQKTEASTEKAIKKLDKKIIKKAIVKAKIENKIIEDLADAQNKEIEIRTAEVVIIANESKSNGVIDADIEKADAELKEANQQIEQASILRAEAKNEKNPLVANEKLKEAVVLEQEALVKVENSNRTYRTAEVINTMAKSETVIVNVEEDKSQRASTKLFKEADDLELQANYYENRSLELADSSTTVKKKYKNAILIEANKNTEKANEYRQKAQDIRGKATELKSKEDEIVNSIPKTMITEVDSELKEEAIVTDTYKSYYKAKTEADKELKEAQVIDTKIEEIQSKSKRKIRQAIVIGGETSDIVEDPELKKLQAEIDSLRQLQKVLKESALTKYKVANTILDESDMSDESKENIIALTNQNIKPKDKVIEIEENPLLADFTPPTKLNQNIFRTTETAIYEATTDIPVDAKQPLGLVYKVQIGAFRNAPDKTYFEKFAPVSGQSIRDGITRYMVGYFTSFTPANTAKNQVRSMGDYKDAFVVAYYNGERISMSKAKQLEAESGVIDQPLTATNPQDLTTVTTNPQTSELSTDGNGNIKVVPTTTEDIQSASYYTSASNAAEANQVEIMKGLFFTVQIGVYSKPVKASVLYNITPLNSQLTTSQKIRYTTGIFNSVAAASERKSVVVAKGVSDAFVTAYYNGNRITVAEARKIVQNQGESILFLNKQSSNTKSDENLESSNPNESKDPVDAAADPSQTSNNYIYNSDNIYYRILIGKFKDKVPSKYANFLFNSEGIIFETETDFEENIFLYTTKQKSIAEVKSHLIELSELGVEDMKLITYYNISIIPFEQSQKIEENALNEELNALEEPDGVNADFLLYNPDLIYYKVEIAKYSGNVPVDLAASILSLDPDTFDEDQDEDGNTVYFSNKLDSYEEAEQKLKAYKTDGFVNAKVKAYHKYKEININKAKAIKGK